MSQKYQPSNGTEGMIFMEKFCDQCIHECPDENSKRKCEIITLTMCLSVKHEDYPKEWTYDTQGKPTCTKYQKWDWNNDGDPDDPDNPKAPVIPDPNQLNLFPLFPDDRDYTAKRSKILENA